MTIAQKLVNQVATLLNDDPDVVLEFEKFEKQPGYSDPPPPPRKKKRHPLPKPVYPGSPQDEENKARKARDEEQIAREKKGTNRSPFGDDIERDLASTVAEMLTDDPDVVLEFGLEQEVQQQPRQQAQKPPAAHQDQTPKYPYTKG